MHHHRVLKPSPAFMGGSRTSSHCSSRDVQCSKNLRRYLAIKGGKGGNRGKSQEQIPVTPIDNHDLVWDPSSGKNRQIADYKIDAARQTTMSDLYNALSRNNHADFQIKLQFSMIAHLKFKHQQLMKKIQQSNLDFKRYKANLEDWKDNLKALGGTYTNPQTDTKEPVFDSHKAWEQFKEKNPGYFTMIDGNQLYKQINEEMFDVCGLTGNLRTNEHLTKFLNLCINLFGKHNDNPDDDNSDMLDRRYAANGTVKQNNSKYKQSTRAGPWKFAEKDDDFSMKILESYRNHGTSNTILVNNVRYNFSSILKHTFNNIEKLTESIEIANRELKGRDRELSEVASIITAFAMNYKYPQKSYLNMIVCGPAGSGKTTLCEHIGAIFRYSGLVFRNAPLKVTTKVDFVGAYLGQSAPLTLATLNSALESTIFIDEAYDIAACDRQGGNGKCAKFSQYGEEAVTQLVAFASQNRGCICILMAGYYPAMHETILSINEGVGRRFPIQFNLKPYSDRVLLDILYYNLHQSNIYLTLDQSNIYITLDDIKNRKNISKDVEKEVIREDILLDLQGERIPAKEMTKITVALADEKNIDDVEGKLKEYSERLRSGGSSTYRQYLAPSRAPENRYISWEAHSFLMKVLQDDRPFASDAKYPMVKTRLVFKNEAADCVELSQLITKHMFAAYENIKLLKRCDMQVLLDKLVSNNTGNRIKFDENCTYGL